MRPSTTTALDFPISYGPIRNERKHSNKRISPYPHKKITHKNVESHKYNDSTFSYACNNCRSFYDYEKYFRSDVSDNRYQDLSKYLALISKTTSQMTVLDCGAGNGTAMDTLLEANMSVKKCTGISMHYFQSIEERIVKNQGRLEWYVGKAETILPSLNEKFDIITDVYGAYFYSSERIELIKQYHRLLKPNGRAFIYLGCNLTENIIHLSNDQTANFDEVLKKYPRTFNWGKSFGWGKSFSSKYKYKYLVITKSTMRTPALNYRVKKTQKKCWKLKRENNFLEKTYYPHKVHLELTPRTYTLRPLAFSRL